MLTRSQGALAAGATVFNALIWGVSWWPFRELQSHGLHPLWATAIVYVLSLAVLLLVRPRAWRGLLQHPMLWSLVVATGLGNVGFNWAVTSGDVIRVVLLFYLMPAWTVLLAWPLLGERPGVGSLLRLALALAGMVVVLKTPSSPWPIPESTSDWLALMSGLMFALTNILLRRLRNVDNEFCIFSMFAGGAVLATIVACAGTALGLVAGVPAPNVAWISVAALISLAILCGNIAMQYGAARLRATTTSLIMMSELLFASVSAVLLGAGELPARTLYGGALILLAVLLTAMSPPTEVQPELLNEAPPEFPPKVPSNMLPDAPQATTLAQWEK